MAMDDLLTAIQMFNKSVDEYKLTEALQGASRQAQDIKASAMKEEEKRAALQGISNQLVSQMGAFGAPVASIAQQAAAVGPHQFANGDAAILEGKLSNNPFLVNAGVSANELAKKDELKLADANRAFLGQQKELDRENALTIAGMKKPGAKPLSQGELTKLQEHDDAYMAGQELKDLVTNNPQLVGVFAGRVPLRKELEGDYSRFQAALGRFQDVYRRAITGQGAGPSELNMLMSRLPSGTDPTSTFIGKMDDFLKQTNTSRTRYLTNLKRANRDVTQYETDLNGMSISNPAGNAAAPAGHPAMNSTKLVTLRDKNTGQLVQAVLGADGKYYPAQPAQ